MLREVVGDSCVCVCVVYQRDTILKQRIERFTIKYNEV